MSWQAQRAVLHHSTQTNILLYRLLDYLAEKADVDGLVDPCPTQGELASFFDCTERTIYNRLDKLTESGELTLVKRGHGLGNQSIYQINLPIDQIKEDHESQIANLTSRIEVLEANLALLVPVVQQLQLIQETLSHIVGKVEKETGNKPENDRKNSATTREEKPETNRKMTGKIWQQNMEEMDELSAEPETNRKQTGNKPENDRKNLAANADISQNHDPEVTCNSRSLNTLQEEKNNINLNNIISEPEVQKKELRVSSSRSRPAKAEQDVAMGFLEKQFSIKTQLPLPQRRTEPQRKAAAIRWWNPLREMLDLCEWNTERAERLLSAALREADKNGMNVSAPESLLKTAQSLFARAKRNGSVVEKTNMPVSLGALVIE